MSKRVLRVRAAESAAVTLGLSLSSRLHRQVGSLREWFGLSQEAFGDALGVSRSTVVRWERNGTRPHPESAEGGWFAVLTEVKRLAGKLWPDNSAAARGWFRSRSIPAFRGRPPVDALTSPKGLLNVYYVLLAETEGGYS
jgi:uncharacterized protein (DUF2384 family)